MSQPNASPNGPAPHERRSFTWSFSLGGNEDEARRAIDAARAQGIQPEVRQHVWEIDPVALLQRLERHDPLSPWRRFLIWLPRALFLAAFLGGIILGCFEPTLGPAWGGIFGGVLGAFFYKMTQPSGWW